MNVVDISRWQFGITTAHHFIRTADHRPGPAPRIMQTLWVVTDNLCLVSPHSKFFFRQIVPDQLCHRRGDRNVQEFQFGTTGASTPGFVGDVFGAPAMRAWRPSSNPPSSGCGFSAGTGRPWLVHLACI